MPQGLQSALFILKSSKSWGLHVCFLCEEKRGCVSCVSSYKASISAINLECSPRGLISTLDSLSSSFKPMGLRGLPRWICGVEVWGVTLDDDAWWVDSGETMHNDDVAWWVDSGETVHVCKDRCWFKTYESLNDRSILHMGNESTTLVHGRGCVDLRFSSGNIISLFNVFHVPNIRKKLVSSSILSKLNIVNDKTSSTFMSTSKLNDLIIWHARLGHVHFKRMQDMSKDGLIPAFDMDTEKFSRPSQRSLINGIEDIGASVVLEKVTKEAMVQQSKLDLRKSKKNRTPKNFKPEFQLYLIKRTMDEISDQHSYCFNVMDNIFKKKLKVDKTIKKFKARLVIKGFRQKSGIDYFDTYALVAHISTIRLMIAMSSIHNLIIHQMDMKTTFLNGELDEEASKKQTCITGSTMEIEFVALAATGKESEWLRNLILEIPFWSKPIVHISIRCDSAATLAKAYSQMYNGKSRHLGVSHSMIRELIMNGVVSIEFVRSQQNLADHITKGLARDLVLKSAEGICLKSNLVTEC
ncbi:zinc finger, CCHC-type containing protein [Tanacetum coccineum]